MVDKNIYIVQGEINAVVGAIKRNARWSTHTHLVSYLELLLSVAAGRNTSGRNRLALEKYLSFFGTCYSTFVSKVGITFYIVYIVLGFSCASDCKSYKAGSLLPFIL